MVRKSRRSTNGQWFVTICGRGVNITYNIPSEFGEELGRVYARLDRTVNP